MNKIILRFFIVKNKKVLEVIFDTRLNFNENFNLLKDIYDIGEISEKYIVDINKNVALKKDVPIGEFNFQSFITLYIYQRKRVKFKHGRP